MFEYLLSLFETVPIDMRLEKRFFAKIGTYMAVALFEVLAILMLQFNLNVTAYLIKLKCNVSIQMLVSQQSSRKF